MIERAATKKQDKAPGILDHLSDGMSLLLIAPWLMAVPVLIDIYLLFGPGISSLSLTAGLGSWIQGLEGRNASDLGSWMGAKDSWDITGLTALLIPSVADGLPQSATYDPVGRSVFGLSSWGIAAAGAGLVLFGSLLFIAFESWLARTADLLDLDGQSVIGFVLSRWVCFLGVVAMAAACMIAFTAALLTPAMAGFGAGLDSDLVLGLVSLVGFVALVLTMFVPEAIVLDRAGPIRAIRSSATVVFRSFSQSIGFLVVSFMISPGLLSIWEEIAHRPLGLGVAIILNAALVTSLSLASLSFYRSRIDSAQPQTHSV